MQEQELEQTLRDLIQQVAEHPDDATVHLKLAQASAHAGRHADAEQACVAALRLQPDLCEAAVLRGWALVSLGRAEEALPLFDHVLQLEPSLTAAHVQRAHALNRLERFAEALAALEQAAAIAPLGAHDLRAMAWILDRLDRHADSCAVLLQTFELLADHPENAKAREELLGRLSTSAHRHRIEPARIREFEAELDRTPDSLPLRVLLAACRSGHSLHASPAIAIDRQKAVEHAVWLIRHHPHQCTIVTLWSPATSENEQVRAAWQDAIEAAPQDVVVLANAAQCLRYDDPALAAELYRRLRLLEPHKAEWPDQLADIEFNQRIALFGDAAAVRDQGRRALAVLEQAMTLPDSGEKRLVRLRNILESALAAEELDRSEQAARELLEACLPESGVEEADAFVHQAHIGLGRVALRRKRVDVAREELRAAARNAWSIPYGRNEPNMRLAVELVEHGEREAVLEFLSAVLEQVQQSANDKTSWNNQRWIDKLIAWKALVQAGRNLDLRTRF